MNESQPLLILKNIGKSFSGKPALNDVSLDIAAGEIHALLGENGAGKSTLIKVATGAYSLDSGEIFLNGQAISPRSSGDAHSLGISTVYQEVNLLPNLSVAHNLFLGREPTRFGCIRWKEINKRSRELLKRFKLDIDVTQSLSSFPIAIQQLVAIARGVDCSAKILILDEPTASLDADEVKILFSILQDIKAQGVGIVFVTHFLDQVYAITDRISVLRNGNYIGTFETAQLPRSKLISHMLGKELLELENEQNGNEELNSGKSAIELVNLTASNGINDVSFSAVQGKILGLAGLLGAGRTEICEILFGLAKTISGNIKADGVDYHVSKPAEAIELNVALCPEDRKTEGIIGPLSIRENIILALQTRQGWWKPISAKEQIEISEQAVSNLSIVCQGINTPIENLSGGNQQKVILARWIATQPKILILDEPTRGIDIGAHAEIIKLIRKLCSQGLTVIVASSEIEELVAFSDRVIVMSDRRKTAELNGSEISEQAILRSIAKAS